MSLMIKKEEEHMNKEKVYYTAKEVADILGVSKGHSYKLIQKMNHELSKKRLYDCSRKSFYQIF